RPAMAFPVPVVAILFDSLGRVWELGRALEDARPEAKRDAVATLEKAFEDHPEAMLLHVAVALRLQLLCQALLRDELDEYRKQLHELVAVCQRAAAAPTLTPRSPLRWQTKVVAVIADLVL